MNNHPFTGTGVAVVTPFDANGDIDFPALDRVVRHLTEGGVEYLVVLGTTGESATLTHEEKQQVFRHVAKTCSGRIPLVAGIGGNDTRAVVKDMKGFELEGYTGILTVSPYYNKPSQEGLFQHYRAVADAAPLPVIMYNVPGRTGMNVTAETTLRIAAECPNVIATKEASGNMEQIMRILKHAPAGFSVISGDDGITLPMMALGATGVISVVANAYPTAFSNMVRACLRGDYTSARPLHYALTDIIESMFREGSPSGVKAYLSEMGLCGQHCRMPVVPVSEGHLSLIRRLMAGYGKP